MKTFIIITLFSLIFNNVVFGQCSNPNCGNDFAICGNIAQLNVQNATTGYWTAYNGSQVMTPAPVYSSSSSATNTNVVIPTNFIGNEIVKFVWTDNSGPCTDTVVVEFVEVPVVNAGVDFDVCGPCAELNCVSGGFVGSWLPNGAAIDNWMDPNTEVCVNQYVPKIFTWLESNSATTASLSCSDMDEVEVTFWREPTATVFSDLVDTVVCGLNYEDVLTQNPANGQCGYWICPSCGYLWSPMFPDLNDFVVDTPGSYGFYWVLETGPDFMPPGWCNDTAGPLLIHFLNENPLFAGNDASVFGFSFELNAVSDIDYPYSQCAYQWENEDAVFEDISSLQTSVTVSEYGEYEFVLYSYYENMPECIDSDTVKVNFRDPIYIRVDESEKYGFEIFPNPSTGLFTLQSEYRIESIIITDINGKQVLQIDTPQSVIDISNLDQGIYIIKIAIFEGLIVQKVVKH
jgi:hypothetical protein